MTKETKSPALKSINLKGLRLPRPVLFSVLGIIGILAVSTLALAGYTTGYRHQVYPKTFIGETDFGGKTEREAAELLTQAVGKLPNDIPVYVDDKQVTTLPQKEIALAYDAELTAKKLLEVGRVGSLSQNLAQLFRSVSTGNRIEASYSVDNTKVDALLTKAANEVGDLPIDAKIVLNEKDELLLSPAKDGRGVTPEQLKLVLLANLSNLKAETHGTTAALSPKISDLAAQPALEQTKAILAKTPLTLSFESQKITADNDKVFSWLTYQLREEPKVESRLPKAQAQTTQALEALIDNEKVKSFVKDFATGVDVEAQNAELRAIDSSIKVMQLHRDGKKVRIDETARLLVEKLSDTALSDTISVTADVEVAQAEIRDNNIEALGIKELIGRAETSYTGSPENRRHNIATGAKFLNGLLIPPGKEFSTVSALGAVDGSNGYLPELVIKENRTVPEFGGGLCQVSTTLFRATLNAGLKITERSNHSYRVSYYEPPLGLDATIYLPKPDFKFTNDTPGYILMQSKIVGTKITFELYGTKDGRSSNISDTTVTSTTPAPEPVYADTDTLKKGETKQIEKPHDGATTVVTYTVTRNGEEINKQVFRSRYKAWPARFLVGTAE